MAINNSDLKIYKSLRLNDFPTGGGGPSNNELPPNEVNGLFSGINDVDLVAGETEIRQIFPWVKSDNTDKLGGANLMIQQAPSSEKVQCLLFSLGQDGFFAERTEAGNYVESYYASSAVSVMRLLGTQQQGQSEISVYMTEDATLPAIGDVFYLSLEGGGFTPSGQFVRIEDISNNYIAEFVEEEETFKRRVLILKMTAPLIQSFPAKDPTQFADTSATRLRTTIPTRTAKYYGVTNLKTAATAGAYNISVDSIYGQLVPSSQQETAFLDYAPDLGIGLVSMNESMSASRSLSLSSGQSASIFTPFPIMPNSLRLTIGGIEYRDRFGALIDPSGNTPSTFTGIVSYSGGSVAISATSAVSGTATLTATRGASLTPTIKTNMIHVAANNQARTFSFFCFPPPVQSSVRLIARMEGRWYGFADDGGGIIYGESDGLGSGSINYSSGSGSISLLREPDPDSAILIYWIESVNYTDVANSTFAEMVWEDPDADAEGFWPAAGATWTWPGGTASAGISGQITGDATGRIFYSAKRWVLRFNSLPAAGSSITFSAERAMAGNDWKAVTISGAAAGGSVSGILEGAPIVPGSVSCAWSMRGMATSSYRAHDDGAGSMVATIESGPGEILSAEPEDPWASEGVLPPTPGTVVPTFSGTIDYNSGAFSQVVVSGAWVDYTYSATESFQETAQQQTSTGQSVTTNNQNATQESISRGPVEGAVMLSGSYGYYLGGYTPTSSQSSRSSSENNSEQNQSSSSASTGTSESLNTQWSAQRKLNTYEGPLVVSYLVGTNPPSEAFTTSEPITVAATIFSPTRNLIPSSIALSIGVDRAVVRNTQVVKNVDPSTGSGTLMGTFSRNKVTLQNWPTGWNGQIHYTGIVPYAEVPVTEFYAHLPSPLRPNGIQIYANQYTDNAVISATSDGQGIIKSGTMLGIVDYNYGVLKVSFGYNEETPDGTFWRPIGVWADTIRINGVTYSSVSIPADIIGLDPVRLPQDGRVPFIEAGSFLRIFELFFVQQATLVAGEAYTTHASATSPAIIWIEDATGKPLYEDQYAVDLNAATVTMALNLNLTGFVGPFKIYSQIENRRLARFAKINGQIQLSHPLSRNFSTDARVASMLLMGDMQARMLRQFSQTTWTNVWSETIIGSPTLAVLNLDDYPLILTNGHCLTESWLILFESIDLAGNSAKIRVVGKNLGILLTDYRISTSLTPNIAPISPRTGGPLWTLDIRAFGIVAGWSSGNAIRFDTQAAAYPVQISRCVLPGDLTPGETFETRLQFRGNYG